MRSEAIPVALKLVNLHIKESRTGTIMGSKIKALGIYLPETVLTNEQLAREFGRWEPDKIESKLGIRERHLAAKDETAGDLAFNAASKVLSGYDRT